MTQQEEWKLQKVCLKIQFSALELDFRVQLLPRIEYCFCTIDGAHVKEGLGTFPKLLTA